MIQRSWRLLLLAALSTTAGPFAGGEEAPRLAARHQRWLDEVAPLILSEERDAFEGLEHDYRRDQFIDRFWRARDPHPGTARNEFRDLWEARLTEAQQRFGTLSDSRGQAFLLAGEPARRQRTVCSEHLLPLEIWTYASGPHVPRAISVVFLKQLRRSASYRIWAPEEGIRALLLDPGSLPLAEPDVRQALLRGCMDGSEVVEQLSRAVSARELRTLTVPATDPEWVAAFLARSTDVDLDARTFEAGLEIGFPDRYRSRTIVEAKISVPKTALTGGRPDEDYRFLVDGEILRHGELFESFRYRFELPRKSVSGPEIPLILQRYLRPGEYTLVLRAEDLVGQSFFRRTREVEVPLIAREPVVHQQPQATPGSPTAVPGLVATTPVGEPATRSTDHSVTVLRPPSGLLTGKVRIHAQTTGAGIAKVAFELDGRRLMSKRRPPWTIEVDLGPAPRLHSLRAVALGTDGSELASDEITVNAGPQRFAVRFVEPEPGRTYETDLRARAVVEVPRGSRLDRLELFLNETRLSTLYQPPFVQSLPLPESTEMAYLRAVAYLDDGHSTESVVFINAPQHLDRLDIDLVELYTTVVDRRGRPVEGLERGDFTVFENDARQEILRFENASDLPFHAAVVIDTSTSMIDQLHHVERAALTFFQKILTPRDRAAVVTFNDRPRLVVPFTSNLEVLAGGLAGMRAEGETALHDSVAFTLYHFGGVRGQRAMILLSDGQDSVSRFNFGDTLDFARETGVAIYTIGLAIPTTEHEARTTLIRLCRETGGQHFFIGKIGEIDRVYETIERELRSQYLLAYQSSHGGDDSFRTIEVRMSDPAHTAKTLRGYKP